MPGCSVKWPVEVKESYGDCLLVYVKCDDALITVKNSKDIITFPGDDIIMQNGLGIQNLSYFIDAEVLVTGLPSFYDEHA